MRAGDIFWASVSEPHTILIVTSVKILSVHVRAYVYAYRISFASMIQYNIFSLHTAYPLYNSTIETCPTHPLDEAGGLWEVIGTKTTLPLCGG